MAGGDAGVEMRADRVAYAGEKSVEIGPVGQLEVTNPPPTYYFENDPFLSRQLTGIPLPSPPRRAIPAD